MDLVAIIRIAMRALARNKLRSVLTMLGIIIGVGAVIAMVSVGQGAQQQAQQQIAAMGSNMLFVQSGTVNRGGMRMGWGATKTLVYDDMLAIERESPSVAAAAPGSDRSMAFPRTLSGPYFDRLSTADRRLRHQPHAGHECSCQYGGVHERRE